MKYKYVGLAIMAFLLFVDIWQAGYYLTANLMVDHAGRSYATAMFALVVTVVSALSVAGEWQ